MGRFTSYRGAALLVVAGLLAFAVGQSVVWVGIDVTGSSAVTLLGNLVWLAGAILVLAAVVALLVTLARDVFAS